MSVGPVGPGGGKYSIIEDVAFKEYLKKKNDLEARQSWIYAVLLMSVGPVGPGGGIYPIIYDVVCKVNFQKLIWRPNNRGYMQLCLCLWALSGQEVAYIQVQKMFCAESIFEK